MGFSLPFQRDLVLRHRRILILKHYDLLSEPVESAYHVNGRAFDIPIGNQRARTNVALPIGAGFHVGEGFALSSLLRFFGLALPVFTGLHSCALLFLTPLFVLLTDNSLKALFQLFLCRVAAWPAQTLGINRPFK